MRHETDGDLMKLISQGNHRAFAELFSRHANTVLGYARRILGEQSAAEDISQEIWMSVVKAAPSYKAETPTVRPWLLTMTRNRALNRIRNQRREDVTDQVEEKIDRDVPKDLFENEVLGNFEVEKIRAAIEQLPENQRLVLVMWMTEDFSYDDLARELSLSLAGVKSLLFRARQSLAAQLGVEL